MKKSHKKLLRNIIVLIIFLLGIGIFFRVQKKQDTTRINMSKVSLLENRVKADFLSIDIQYKDENNFVHKTRITNIRGSWVVTQPLYKTANQGAVNEMIDILLTIKSETNYTGLTQTQISNYGIFHPNDIFSFRFKDGTVSTIVNGDISKPESYYYTFKLEETNTIYIIYAYKFSAAELTTSQLLEKQIFTDPIDDLTGFTIRSLDGETYSVSSKQVNNKTLWKLTRPASFDTDSFVVKKRILNFYSLHILEFLMYDRQPQDIRTLGLDNPLLSIKTRSPHSDMVLYVSSVTNKSGYFAYSPRIPGIFLLKREDVQKTFNLDIKEFEVSSD